jgi:hypothetical protein
MKTDITFSSGLYISPKKKCVDISELRNRQNNGDTPCLTLEAEKKTD